QKVHDLLAGMKAIDQQLDAVIASNDAQAAGAIAALEEAGLAGKVAVSGQDADLAACQRVVEGTQAVVLRVLIRLWTPDRS
ncbi:MAG: substrate-binding domain-containing protein, partial [Planctomycetes bacterium]|nr:substrate-binding domain-containing protein [Planctomycetota bacterium]